MPNNYTTQKQSKYLKKIITLSEKLKYIRLFVYLKKKTRKSL